MLVGRIIGVERFLRRAEGGGNVLQVDADARPRVKTAAHRVDEHIGGLEMCARFRMARPPAIESRKRVLFPARPRNLDERMLRRPPP